MPNRPPLQIDMLIDGRFRVPPRSPIAMRIAGIAIIVAVLAGGLAVAALVLWFAVALIPIAVIAGAVAWAAIRFQLWRSGRPGRARDLFRP